MASSNRHWPSMFKSKPCNTTTHHQWQQQHDVNSTLLSSPCTRTPFNTPGCEERTPEPKPRWNPRPEQIGILESIFNSGMVNPPRDEIRKIRAQLQEFGQVGDANVFYWFQNRKSRSKHKHRQNLHHTPKSRHPQQTTTPPPPSTTAAAAPPSSSSSSSDKSSPNNSSEKSLSVGPITVIDLLNSPTASVNQPFFHANANEFLAEPFFFPAVQQNAGSTHSPPPSITQGFYFPDNIAADQNTVPNNFLLSELMLMGHYPSSKKDEDDKLKFHQQQQQQNLSNYASTSAPNPCQPILPPPFSVPSINQILQGAGVGETVGPTRSTVFINDVCFEVGYGPFSVREAFGDDAVLIHSSGHPVLTDEWGVTLQPLQHGGFYYLSRPFAAPSPVDRTIDLI